MSESGAVPDAAWLGSLTRRLRSLYRVDGGDAGKALAAVANREPAYTVVREVARGGMGTILEVVDERLDRTLAMKVATPGDAQHVVALLDEARLMGQLQHPGIAPVHEIGVDAQGRAYFTMPLVAGRTLADVFAQARESGAVRGLEILVRVCDTLAYAHQREVVHRDLKPSNVLVGRFGEVYVVDWGVAARVVDGAAVGDAVAGTPFYMAPEQVAGESVGPSADVYAAGALLYELVSGAPPYAGQDATSADDVWRAIAAGPPRALEQVAPDAAAELVAIAERAMQREPAARYATLAAMAEDLRAYLADRVVKAHRTGPLAELRKWLRRNRAVAATLAVSLAVVAAGSGVFVARLASERDRADARLQEILDLSVVERVKELRRRADEELWPAYPAKVPAMRAWLREARFVREVRAALRTRAAELAAAAPSESARRWHARLVGEALTVLDRFLAPAVPETFLGASFGEVERRLAFAETIAARSLGEAAASWRGAIEGIARSPHYGGLAIAAQIGLVPLGPDPRSGLWEFAHLQSGAAPVRDGEGRLQLDETTGLVLVLIPAQRFAMGAQRAGDRNVDPQADEANEIPVHDVELAAFFIAKFEMTQAQWARVVGENPSNHDARSDYVDAASAPLHPVENVSWDDCRRVLFRLGLHLPTEAQWECAARAGSATPWPGRDSMAALRDPVVGNLADATCFAALGSRWACDLELRDGFVMHAPVGSFVPNAFGLHDVVGNVWEWCRDEYVSYQSAPGPGDGARPLSEQPGIVMQRGGAFDATAVEARAANRAGAPPDRRYFTYGVRPARQLDAAGR